MKRQFQTNNFVEQIKKSGFFSKFGHFSFEILEMTAPPAISVSCPEFTKLATIHKSVQLAISTFQSEHADLHILRSFPSRQCGNESLQ